jgi:hypothetical protein
MLPPGVEKARKLAAQDEDRPPAVDPWQAGLQPATHGVLVRSEQLRDLLHRVAPVDLYAPRVQPLHVESSTGLMQQGMDLAVRIPTPMTRPLCRSAKRGGLYARQKSCQLCGDGQAH